MKQIGIVILFVAAPVLLMGQSAPKQEAAEAVARFALEIEATLVEKLDAATLLSPSCKEVVKIMRIDWGVAVSASSWGMDSSLVRQIGDDELCRYVITRAQFHLELVAALFSRVSLKDFSEKSEAVLKEEIKQFWPGRDLSPTESRGLVDSSGRTVLPEQMETREELAQYWNLWNEFRGLSKQQRNWNTPTLKENVSESKNGCEWLRELSQSDVEELGFFLGNPVYEACVLFLYVFIQDQGGQPRVLYMFPKEQ